MHTIAAHALDCRGTYALLLKPREPSPELSIGARGRMPLRKSGCYIYVGSAHGGGGLAARLSRHLTSTADPHWHIDYLRRACSIRGALVASGVRELEHVWFRRLASIDRASLPMIGFGSSDCSCTAHLVHVASRVPVRLIGAALAGDCGPLPRYVAHGELERALS
jgi:Uri superfamily endonuclease